jgi:hemolysin III
MIRIVPTRGYTLGEEIANSITHGIGALLAIAGLVVLVVLAVLRGTAWHVVGCAVFGATLVVLYTSSTLYHAISHTRARAVLQVLDHTAIYLLIAGTYTPFMLVTLRGPWGWSLFGIVWAVAVTGIALRAVLGRRLPILRVALYIVVGWVGIVAFRPLVASVGLGGVLLVVGGGLAYTLGVVFYAQKRLPYSHAVWHLFVLAGSTLHFFAVLLYVVR